MSQPSKRYRAFISYSQKDKARARRLHQALESYSLPKRVGAAAVDAKTRKLGRFFLDDEEMGAATDLGAALQGAIADAESLIVVCSPNAAQSKWVNAEIIHFKRTGRAEKIFAVVVAGTPHSADEQECFPPALRFALASNGALSEQRAEPLAVDLRKERFERVLTRLAAGLAEIPFDSLWKREQRRAATRALTLSLTVFFVTLLVGGALTQSIWYPKAYAYWRYARHVHSTEDLMASVPGSTFQDCREGSADCPVMVVIPEGTFLMGEAPGYRAVVQAQELAQDVLTAVVDRASRQFAEEQSQAVIASDERRRISLVRFAVSQHEVTFTDWQACVEGGGCRGAAEPADMGWGRETRPVINITWEDSQDYARWLSQMTGRDYRLLTEAEWEYAARGVTSADDPRNGEWWSFGNDQSQMDDFAWFGLNSNHQTHPVGTKRANPFGLYDMYGNVFEWVQDCYADYDPSKLDGSAVEADGEASSESGEETSCYMRVLRGGSFFQAPLFNRSADRSMGDPVIQYNFVGFRVARTL